MNPPVTKPISVVGLVGEVFGINARRALADATVVVGSNRQLELVAGLRSPEAESIELRGALPALLDTIAERASAQHAVCVLASGDPGFFGIVGVLSERFGREALRVHPAPSSVSLAFARLGLAWDDAVVVSAHGRSLDDAVARVVGPKVALLTSPDNPPEVIGGELRQRGHENYEVVVVSRIGQSDETMEHTDLEGLAIGRFDPLSVVVLMGRDRPPRRTPLSWGLPEASFEHRDGMITKAEVRAVALGKLALPERGILWDVGAGSGSVAVECARLRPGLRVVAIERSRDDAARIAANASAHGVVVEVVCSEAPAAFERLPDPDRVFVGGGGLEVLHAARARLRPSGTIVATYALVERAVSAQRQLGNLVQISLSRAVATGDLGIRLAAENPVFVCWGPSSGEDYVTRSEGAR